MTQRIADFLIKYRFLLFILSALSIAASTLGLAHIKYVADYKIFFPPDDPNLRAFESLQSTYTRADNVVYLVVPKDGNMFSKEALSSMQWLTDKGWKTPYSIRVDSLSNFQYTHAEGDELLVEDLVPKNLSDDPAVLKRIHDIAMNEPMLAKKIITPAGDAALVAITLELPEDQTQALAALMEGEEGVNSTVDQFKAKFPGVDIHVTGVAVSNYYLGEIASQDFGKLMPLLLLVVLVLVGLMTKSFSNTVVTLSIIIVSVTVTIGCVGALGIDLDNVSAIAPMIIMTLAVAESVHILSSYSLKLREGLPKIDAMQDALASNLKAVFLTSFTTAVGFLGMNSIDSPPFVKFGYIASAGIIIAYIFTHTMLPQLALWFSRAHKGEPEIHEDKLHTATSEWVIANPKKVFFSTLTIAVSLSCCMFLNEMNDDNIGYFGKKLPIRICVDTASEKGLGFNYIEYSLKTNEQYGVTDIAYLKKVEKFVEWYRQQPEVVHVFSFVDILKRLNQTMHGDDPAYYTLPESRELASQYMLMYEMSLPVGMDLNNQIDTRKSSLRLTVSTKILKAKENLALEARAQNWLATNAPELQTPGTSLTIMFSHIGQQSIKSVALGTASSIGIICLCMIFGFGSIRLGLMALLPNIFPTAIALGLWGLFVGEVNMGVAVIFTITDGIIVDDTIHLFSKFRDGLRKGLNVDDAIRFTFEHAGKGVLITTTVLCAGFAVMTLSDFMVNRTVGILVSGTIAIAVLFDLLFLPSVLKIFPIRADAFVKKTSPAETPESLSAPV